MKPCAWRVVAALAALLVFALAWGAGPPPVEVISPPANAVLPAAPFEVICRGGPAGLTVDGRRQPWGIPGAVRATRLRLGPGRHEIRVGDRTLTVWVEGEPAPEGRHPARLHPTLTGTDRCAGCHETSRRGELTAVGKALPDTACLECHKPAQFELKHAHPLEPLRHCTSCHAPHGSVHKGLLKAPAKTLCAACHDS